MDGREVAGDDEDEEDDAFGFSTRPAATGRATRSDFKGFRAGSVAVTVERSEASTTSPFRRTCRTGDAARVAHHVGSGRAGACE